MSQENKVLTKNKIAQFGLGFFIGILLWGLTLIILLMIN